METSKNGPHSPHDARGRAKADRANWLDFEVRNRANSDASRKCGVLHVDGTQTTTREER